MKKKKPENEITNYSNNDVITTMIVIILAEKMENREIQEVLVIGMG